MVIQPPANAGRPRRARAFIWPVIVAALIIVSGGIWRHGASAQPSPTSPASASSPGKVVYDAHCVECHGKEGKGDGPAALTLLPHPRDFTNGNYKIRSTESGSTPTDSDLERSIRQGLPGSSMPAWTGILSDGDIRAVVSYIKSLSPRFAEQPQPIAVTRAPAESPDRAKHGADVYSALQCGKCHGQDGRGNGATTTSFEDDWGYPMRAANLSEPWTFRGGATTADVFMRFRAGMSGTPMPSYKDAASDADMWDLASYVGSLRRKPVWEMNADEVVTFYRDQDAAAKANPTARGEYLVNTLGCPVCHTPIDEDKRPLPGMRFAGGARMYLAPFGTYPTGNLTSDKETGLGNWTDGQIKQVITKGILKDGTRLLPFPMDWASYSTLAPSDLDAIVAYLRTIPPVRNSVPKISRTSLPLFLWGKFQMLMLGTDLPSYTYSGNAGTMTEAR
jgi:cbb3-type cytochrome c oxidase subunit III